jgi:peptide deformylase
MALRQVLHFPNPNLRLKAKAVKKIDHSIKALVDDMFETMYEEQGIGLAATQIDVQLQVITMDVMLDKKNPYVFINPVITERNGTRIEEEGCLSVPGIAEKVKRADSLIVKALDLEGKEFELKADSLLATCIQHEMDHLEGILFIDRLSRLKKYWITKKFKKS